MNNGGISEINGKAIASFILGILSIVTLIFTGIGIILGVTGLILGIIGLKEIKRFNQEGRKMAIAGIICSSIPDDTASEARYGSREQNNRASS